MKLLRLNLFAAIIISGLFFSCQNMGTGSKADSKVDSVSYIMGVLDGQRVVKSLEQAKLDKVVLMPVYSEAFIAAVNEAELKIDPTTNMDAARNFLKNQRDYQMAVEKDSLGDIPEFQATQETLDSISYILGASDGQNLKNSFSHMGIDTLISYTKYLDGFSKAVNQEEIGLNPQEKIGMINAYFMEARYGKNKQDGIDFLAKNKERSEVTETESGLQYEIITEGDGEMPTDTSTVKVHYHGTLIDGTVFDSSVDRGEPVEFQLNRVIKGWTEGLQLMKVGSKYKFYIPYDLAYGDADQGVIKPFSTLIFEVELLSIVK